LSTIYNAKPQSWRAGQLRLPDFAAKPAASVAGIRIPTGRTGGASDLIPGIHSTATSTGKNLSIQYTPPPGAVGKRVQAAHFPLSDKTVYAINDIA